MLVSLVVSACCISKALLQHCISKLIINPRSSEFLFGTLTLLACQNKKK